MSSIVRKDTPIYEFTRNTGLDKNELIMFGMGDVKNVLIPLRQQVNIRRAISDLFTRGMVESSNLSSGNDQKQVACNILENYIDGLLSIFEYKLRNCPRVRTYKELTDVLEGYGNRPLNQLIFDILNLNTSEHDPKIALLPLHIVQNGISDMVLTELLGKKRAISDGYHIWITASTFEEIAQKMLGLKTNLQLSDIPAELNLLINNVYPGVPINLN